MNVRFPAIGVAGREANPGGSSLCGRSRQLERLRLGAKIAAIAARIPRKIADLYGQAEET